MGLLVGYDANSYIIWNPRVRKTLRSRDVAFDEKLNDYGEICKNFGGLANNYFCADLFSDLNIEERDFLQEFSSDEEETIENGTISKQTIEKGRIQKETIEKETVEEEVTIDSVENEESTDTNEVVCEETTEDVRDVNFVDI
ncbi:unnamed protein product [Euphydryas editha]|uniref:Retroviral polymerase SH3-like domain-containing protein n=1 Tax=Euphydryas editha TaxID=104508 RepID=A0AAU9TU52_EUPED|nr:unnamed protein product [Euphydryas editha]